MPQGCCGRAIPTNLYSKISKIEKIIALFTMQSLTMRSKRILIHFRNGSSRRVPKMLWTSHSSTTKKVK